MIYDPPGNKMLATWLDCLIGSELSEPSRAEFTPTERISCSVRGFPSQAELRACSARPHRAGGLLGEARLVAKPGVYVSGGVSVGEVVAIEKKVE